MLGKNHYERNDLEQFHCYLMQSEKKGWSEEWVQKNSDKLSQTLWGVLELTVHRVCAFPQRDCTEKHHERQLVITDITTDPTDIDNH